MFFIRDKPLLISSCLIASEKNVENINYENKTNRFSISFAVSVLLYCTVQQALMNEISSNLQTILIKQMYEQGFKLQIDYCRDPKARTFGLPLIVLCINASRLGSDVNQALQSVQCKYISDNHCKIRDLILELCYTRGEITF